MRKRSLSGFIPVRIAYEPLPVQVPAPSEVAPPPQIKVLVPTACESADQMQIKAGDVLRTGQRIAVGGTAHRYCVAPATGTVAAVEPFIGDFARQFTAVSIDLAEQEQLDEEFAQRCQEPSLALALEFLTEVPGAPPLEALDDPQRPIDTIVVYGGDADLLVATQQFVLRTRMDRIQNGIRVLKAITGIERVIIAVPGESLQGHGHIGAEVRNVASSYPAALPAMIMKEMLGQVLPAGKSCEDLGVVFMRAEAVASIGDAFASARIPTDKLLTVIDKDGGIRLVSTRIGTPLQAVLGALDLSVREGDRIICGGPMTGTAVYSQEFPVGPDTDAVMLQDRDTIQPVENGPCTNCGECIRICPTRVPINMLVRLLEASQFEQAAETYDLHACIECGLCSYVCVARIPIFQLIRLAKYELSRLESAEADHA